MKRLIALFAVLLVIAGSSTALASDITNAIWHGIVRVSNNSTSAATAVSVNLTLDTATYLSNGYADNTSDIAARINGADIAFQPGRPGYPWSFFAGDVNGLANKDIDLYSNGVTGGKIRAFFSDSGATVADNATLELGDNFTVSMAGYVNTDFGSEKFLINKSPAFNAGIFSDGTIAATINSTTTANSTVMAGASKEYYTINDDGFATTYGANWYAQSTANLTSNATITSISIKFYRALAPDTVTVALRTSGGSNNLPTGANLATGTIDGNSATTVSDGFWYEAAISPAVAVTSGNSYAVLVYAATGNVTDYIRWRYDTTPTSYANGNGCSSTDSGVTWAAQTYDFMFALNASASAIASGEKTVTPSLTQLLRNRSFEDGGTTPSFWSVFGAGATHGRSITQVYDGTFSCNLTRAGTNCGIYQSLTNTYAGMTLYYSAPVWASVANRAYLGIQDSVGTSMSSAHSGSSAWEILTVSRTINAGATLNIQGLLNTGDTTVYYDLARATVGLVLTVDGTPYYGACYTGVPDNAIPWYFAQKYSMSYMESENVTVNGTQVAHWEWQYADTLTDTINSIVMTPSFRTTSSDADVSATFISLEPVTKAELDNWTISTSYSILTNTLSTPDNMYAGKNWTKIPGAEVVNDILAEAQVPESAWWYPFIFIGIGVIGMCVYGGTTMGRNAYSRRLHEGQVDGSLVAMTIVCESLLIAFGILEAIPVWPAFIFPLGALAIIMSRKHYSWS